MFNRYKTESVFLTLKDRGESNKFLTAYTKDFGKIKIFAKAIRKKESKLRFGVAVFILNEIEFIEGRSYRTLTDVKILDNFKEIKKDLIKTIYAHKACEELDMLTREEEKDEEIWTLFKSFLKDLDQKEVSGKSLVYYYFIWNLFSLLGYSPELYNCVFCSKKVKKGPVYFSFKEGGITGSCCFKKEEDIFLIGEDEIKALRILIEGKEKRNFKGIKISLQTKKNLENLTEKYLNSLSA